MAFTKSKAEKLRDKLMNKPFSDFIEKTALIQADPTSTYNTSTMTNTLTYAVSITTKGFFPKFDQSQLLGELQDSDTIMIIDSKDLTSVVSPNASVTVGSDVYTVIKSEPIQKTALITQKLYLKGNNNA